MLESKENSKPMRRKRQEQEKEGKKFDDGERGSESMNSCPTVIRCE
jgi:hypothetical protein